MGQGRPLPNGSRCSTFPTMMDYTVIVHSAPHTGQGSLTALAFVRALFDQGHRLQRVFFYHDGAENAFASRVTPQDETDLLAGWVALAQTQGCELAVCIAAALRRGLLNEDDANRYDLSATAASAFTVVGLGQLVEAILQSDRCVTFVN